MATKTITIVFRGLMVFNHQQGCMEIGFINGLPSQAHNGHNHDGPAAEHAGHLPVHIPRILTMRNGVLAAILDLRNRTEELDKIRNWEIKTSVGNPELKVFTVGNFKRTAEPPPDPRDFRWIIDLEGSDLHNRPLSQEMDTRQLLLVLYVKHGEFYTRMKSPVLKRFSVNNPDAEGETYGSTAAVTAVDITIEGGKVELFAGGAVSVFSFDESVEDGTIYEISNAPPDVPADAATPLDAGGHFHMYYDKLFNKKPADQFDLGPDDQAPSPDPAQCGVGFVGQREDPL